MKDIGSIFPLYEEDLEKYGTNQSQSSPCNNKVFYALCREAIFAIGKALSDSNRNVMLPAYTCQTVIDPFIQQGWTCHYYDVNLDLRINIKDLSDKVQKLHPAAVLVHPYYGMELNEEELTGLSLIKEHEAILIEDLTQCILTDNRPAVFDFFVGSYRKWMKIPDGGFLEYHNVGNYDMPENEFDEFVLKQKDAMFLRGQYFTTGNQILKDISIRLNKEAGKNALEIQPLHRMSDFSLDIWNNEEKTSIESRRIENYRHLFNGLKKTSSIRCVCGEMKDITTAPLYFPIYAGNRADLQKTLASEHIYAPILWPVQTQYVLINDNIRYIYDSILMLPIDQRYDSDDMDRILKILNSYG